MPLTLSPELEEALNRKVAEGAFASPEDVIRAGLDLIERRAEQLAALKDDIAIADLQLEQGMVAAFDPRSTLARVRRDKLAQGI